MNGNNGNGSRRNGNNGRARASLMDLAPTRHQPERASRVRASVMAAAQAAPLRLPGPVRVTRKVSRSKKENNSNKKRVAYAIGSKKSNVRNNLSLSGLSFGNSSFKMKRFNPKKAAQSYESGAASSGFVPQSAHQAFQSQMNEAVARQAAANRQRLANITKSRSNGSKKGWAKRRAEAAARLAAASAAVERAEMDIVGQGQSSSAPSNNAAARAHQALANAREAQRTALDEYTALQQALAEMGMTASSSSAANYANENNGFAYAARANNGSARANNGAASAASSASSTNASFQNFFRSFKP